MSLLLKGVPASRGIVIGTALLVSGSSVDEGQRVQIEAREVEPEIERLLKAVLVTREQLLDLKRRVAVEIGQKQAEIFNAHLLFLDDPTFLVETQEQVRKLRTNAEWAVHEYVERYARMLDAMGDGLMRERQGDIHDVGRRLIQNLRGGSLAPLSESLEKRILVARDLSPSETAQLDLDKVLGFVTDQGGPTSHTAIIARTLDLPAVVGLEQATLHVKNGDTLVLDGGGGVLVVDPDKETLAHYRLKQKELQAKEKELKAILRLPAVTKDGRTMKLFGNIELPEEAKATAAKGAEGVGLFRTEFLFLNRHNLPTEEEQFEAYRLALRLSQPHPVTIRTLDLGGDKFVAHLGMSSEMNPFLGLRAIRLCLAHPYVFKVQLRAILRASHYGTVRIMYPFISALEELRQANQILAETKGDLARRNIPFDAKIEVGAMIEVPSAAITADLLAKEADFFSIGTNDLIQYTMAVDRGNERIAYLYDPLHPAILRTIQSVVRAAAKAKIRLSLCGEMGGDPLFAMVLAGLGLREFSMSAGSIPGVKKVLRSITHREVSALVAQALKLSTGAEIRSLLVESAVGRRLAGS
ncbi:MAG TPA: phosphoenolpyruvate--protein phosphotransferase [bacterium]|nr:phosphoenolpyruvate--protein phosphotransferase [bacterium]